MKQAKIAELKNNLSKYLEYVRRGGVVRVFDRDSPIADLAPLDRSIGMGAPGEETLLDRLEARGTVRRGTGSLPKGFLSRRLPQSQGSVVGAILEDRRKGR